MPSEAEADLSVRLTRLAAYVCALEELLVATVRSLPNRNEILRSAHAESEVLDAMALAEPFSDEEIEEMREARRCVLDLVASPRDVPHTAAPGALPRRKRGTPRRKI